MNQIKNYFRSQADRNLCCIAHDIFITGMLMTCIYFGFVQ
jgi:hypothetical protein